MGISRVALTLHTIKDFYRHWDAHSEAIYSLKGVSFEKYGIIIQKLCQAHAC